MEKASRGRSSLFANKRNAYPNEGRRRLFEDENSDGLVNPYRQNKEFIKR
jgi:hypothetical protein